MSWIDDHLDYFWEPCEYCGGVGRCETFCEVGGTELLFDFSGSKRSGRTKQSTEESSMGKQLIRVNNARHQVVTMVGRLSFPNLFTPKSFQDKTNEAKEYSADIIFDSMDELKRPYNGKKTQTPSLTKAIHYVKCDQWGDDKTRWPKFIYPVIKDGNDQKDKDGEIRNGYEDKVFVKVKSGEKFPPKIVLADGTPATERDVYGGCYVQAQVLVRPYLEPRPGVSLRLLGIRKVKDGEKFGAGADMFDYEEVTEDGEDDWGSTEGEEDDDEGI
jgi:hypothetical protein